jgi:purine-binding chemotaxis protein CheW
MPNNFNLKKDDEKEEAEKRDEYIQLVVFELDTEEYAVEIKDLQEIIKIPDITPIPNTPLFIRGIFNLRGKIIVVIDLERRFNLVRERAVAEGNIIVAEVNENSFGIVVDKVSEIINVSKSSIQPTPALATFKIQAEYLKGVVVIDRNNDKDRHAEKGEKEEKESRLIIFLDMHKMLQEKELMSISQVVDAKLK